MNSEISIFQEMKMVETWVIKVSNSISSNTAGKKFSSKCLFKMNLYFTSWQLFDLQFPSE